MAFDLHSILPQSQSEWVCVLGTYIILEDPFWQEKSIKSKGKVRKLKSD